MFKTSTVALLLCLVGAASAHDALALRHAHEHKRQALSVGVSASVGISSAPAASASVGLSVSAHASAASAAVSAVASAVAAVPSAFATMSASGVPALSAITFGMPAGPTVAVASTYTPGATPPVSGAPPLPTAFVFEQDAWPQLDVPPPTDSDEVQEWMTELDGVDIPDIDPTVDGSCAGDPSAAANASARGWWTCGGWTRPSDITACPDKMTWGVSFDDGPAPYTQKLLTYLNAKDIHATFFAVGSRVVSYPDILIEEYMTGHEISVHTWSHHPLTSLTNEQIVAELGWTRKAIKAVLGVTPTTMRAPYGDIDDRVRAISNAMGLRPIIWTTAPDHIPFDTNDWRVAGGDVTGLQQFATFQSILGNASIMDTGFIVLQHDLYEITVDLAVGYTLNTALTHSPPFSLKAIGECMHMAPSDMYMETTSNKTQKTRVITGTQTGGAPPLGSSVFALLSALALGITGLFFA